MIKKRISELCLLDLTNDEFIRSVEKELAKLVPYKHEESSIHKAVGLAPFEISVASAGRPSEVIEQIEAGQTKRELSFAMGISPKPQRAVFRRRHCSARVIQCDCPKYLAQRIFVSPKTHRHSSLRGSFCRGRIALRKWLG